MSRSAVSTCDVSATSTTESNGDISATPAVSQESTSDVSATSPTSASAAPSPAERKVLRIAQRATGELGGGGAGGPIYGELTPRSMGKVIDALAACCGLDARAPARRRRGAGMPSLVAAQRAARAARRRVRGGAVGAVDPQPRRRARRGLARRRAGLNTAVAFVRHAARATTLDPCTHVYMFDTGFPAATLARLAELFNASSTARASSRSSRPRASPLRLCRLALRAQLAVKMAGSTGAHRARLRARAPPPPPAEPRPAEPMRAGALALRDGSAERRRHDALRQRAEHTRRRSCATPDAARRARARERCRSTHGSMFHVFVAGRACSSARAVRTCTRARPPRRRRQGRRSAVAPRTRGRSRSARALPRQARRRRARVSPRRPSDDAPDGRPFR